jgi:VWFA-related protein
MEPMSRTPRRGPLACAALAVLAGSAVNGAGAARPQQESTRFVSSTSAVMVDVTVHDARRRAITGLTPDDFEVLDNGVVQRVDEVSYGRLPIDVTVALDVSYSVTGPMLDRLRTGVVLLMRDLREGDRLKLMLFNMRVARSTDFTTDVKLVERTIRAAAAGGSTALRDTVGVALVSAAAPDRRQLVVLFTDGSDSSSITTPSSLVAIAGRTRATLAFVMPARTITRTLANPSYPGVTTTTTVIDRPMNVDPLFGTLARETGGTILPVGAATDLSAAFRRVLDEFRAAYVLYYTAAGVEREGYHALTVRVKREGAVVRARRGYFGS